MKKSYILSIAFIVFLFPFLMFGDLIKSKLIEGKTQEEAINIVALETEKNTAQIEDNKAKEEEKINEILPKIEENTIKIVEVKKEVEEIKVNINDMKNKENSTTTPPVTGTPAENLKLTEMLSRLNKNANKIQITPECADIIKKLNRYGRKMDMSYRFPNYTFDKFEELYSWYDAEIKEKEQYILPFNADENGTINGNVIPECRGAIVQLKQLNEDLIEIHKLEKEYKSLNCKNTQ